MPSKRYWDNISEWERTLPILKQPVGRKVEPTLADEKIAIDVYRQPPKPKMYAAPPDNVPGFRLCDIKASMDINDYKAFVTAVPVVGEVDGEKIVYALDYIRWVLEEEKR